MSDVFVSYKRDDKHDVLKVVSQLRASGLSVWWDDDIPPNAPWEETIETALAEAKVVVVAWSEEAAASENVKGEARRARLQGKLIQVFLRPCEPPLFFGERQGINLVDWSGERSDPRFASLVMAVSAVRDGKQPPKGSGHMPKRPSRWPLATLPLLLLFGLPFSLDWMLAVRGAVLLGAGYLLWRGRRFEIAAALMIGILANVGLDGVRYRYSSPYYLVSCSVGDVDCLTARQYKFGKRQIQLDPMIGGAAQLAYVRLVAGKERSDRAYLERERIGDHDALLSPSEMSVLSYLDGGAPTKDVSITYQPLSRRLNPTYPYSNLVFDISFEFHGRPDVTNEVAFSAGFNVAADSIDLLNPLSLKNTNLLAPSYAAQRAKPQTFGFTTPIDTRDQPSLWKRAVINDQLFQLYAANDLDVVLSDLGEAAPTFRDSDRLLYDALVLSYWCGRNAGSGATIACALEMSRIAKETNRLAAQDGVPAKLLLTRQILRIVGSSRLLRLEKDGAPPLWTKSLTIGPFSSESDLTGVLLVDLLARFPELKPYLTPVVDGPSDAPLLDPVKTDDRSLSEYLRGISGLGRSDALQALLPLRRALAEAYSDSMVTEDDLFQWGRSLIDDNIPVSGDTKITAGRVPQTYGYLSHALSAADARNALHKRYLAVDDAVKALGGATPAEIANSRKRLDDLSRLDRATTEFVGALVKLLDKGATFDELVEATNTDSFKRVILPSLTRGLAEMTGDSAIIFDDVGLPTVGACLTSISAGLAGLQKLGDSAFPEFTTAIKTLAKSDAGDSRDKFGRLYPKECLAATSAFSNDKAPVGDIARYISQNPMLKDPQSFLDGDKARNDLVSSRQYLLGASFELASRVAETSEWIGASNDRVAAERESSISASLAPALVAADYHKLKENICSQWREPVWAYSELSNATVGWRRLPLFLAILRMSEVCQGAPTKIVLDHMQRQFGERIVADYVAEQTRPATKVQISGHLNPEVLPALAADPTWSAGDAYLYAQVSLYKRQYDALEKFRSSDAPSRAPSKVVACGDKPCSESDQRLVAAAFTAFAQASATPAALKGPGGSDLFRYSPTIKIDGDAYDDLVDQVFPPIPSALATLSSYADSSALKSLADPLLTQPGEKEYAQLEQIAAGASFGDGGADKFWFSAHSLLSRQAPLLAIKSLDHIHATGLTATAVSIRRAQLLVSAGNTEQGEKAATDILKAKIATADIPDIRLALENGLQVFFAAANCAACQAELAPQIFGAFARLDDLHGNVRDDSTERLDFTTQCLEAMDPSLISAVQNAANAVFKSQKATASPPRAEDLATDSRYVFAVSAKASLAIKSKSYADDAYAKRLLAAIGNQPDLEPTPEILRTVLLLSSAAGADAKPALDGWASRSARRIKDKLARSPDRSLLGDLSALGGLLGESDPRFEAAANDVYAHFTAGYERGVFVPVSPLDLIASTPEAYSNKHPLPAGIVKAYLGSPAFSNIASTCNDNLAACRRDMEGLVEHILGSPLPGTTLSPASRETVIELERKIIGGSPRELSRVTDVLAKELDEPKLVVAADLIRGSAMSPAARDRDFQALGAAIRYVSFGIVERQTLEPARALAPTSLEWRLVTLLIDDYLPYATSLDCCGRISATGDNLSYLVTAKLAGSNRCEWLETRLPLVRLYVRQMEAKGAKLSADPAVASLLSGPDAGCSGKFVSDQIAKASEALKASPNDAQILYARGVLYRKVGDVDRALADYDAAGRIDATKASYQNARCWNRAANGRDLETARSACDAALRIAPGDANSLDSRGMVGLKQKRFQDAWNDYDAATRLDSTKASYLFGRGIAALRLNKPEGYADLAAATKLDRAIRLEYSEHGVSVLEQGK